MSWSVSTAPQNEPITVDEVKANSVVDFSDDDSLIEGLIKGAREYVEMACNRALMPQVWTGKFPDFESVRLAGGRVRSIDSIKYYDTEDVEQTLDASEYRVILSEPAKIAPADHWPSVSDRIDAVTIEASVGYADQEAVPQPLKQAMLLLVGHWYANREAVVVGTIATPVPMSVDALLFPYRVLYP